MKIPFLGGTYNAISGNIDASRAINCYPEISREDSKSVISMIGSPGTALWATVGAGPIRGEHPFNGLMFVVSGNTLYSVTTAGVATALGALATSSGVVSMENNGASALGIGGDQVIVVDGTNGYIYNVATGVFSRIAQDGGFPSNPTVVAYMDGYFIVVSKDTMRYSVSDIYNGLTWNSLAVGSVIASPDPLVSVLPAHNQLWFLKEATSEVWYNAAIPTSKGSPFARVSGSVQEIGIAAAHSGARGANSLFFLGNERTQGGGQFAGVMRLVGYAPQVISPPAMNYQIGKLETISDAIGYCYADAGHTFYVLTFPTADWTIVYDATTDYWHERSTGVTGLAKVRRHVGNAYAYFAGKHLIGDHHDGKIYQMSLDLYDDAGRELTMIRTAQHFSDKNDLRLLSYHRLHIDAESGVGTQTGQGTNPQAALSWSDDGGKKWSSEYYAPMGKIGTNNRWMWRRLGASRDRIFKLTISDPVKRVIVGAYADIT